MKLGELKSKIRTTKGSPLLRIELTPGALGTIALMKTPLMEALDTMYPGGKSVETGLLFEVVGDNAMIRPEASTQPYGMGVAAPGPLLSIMEAPSPVAKINLLDDMPAKVPSSTVNLLDLDAPTPAPKSSTLLDF